VIWTLSSNEYIILQTRHTLGNVIEGNAVLTKWPTRIQK